jgi:hypothetical protein
MAEAHVVYTSVASVVAALLCLWLPDLPVTDWVSEALAVEHSSHASAVVGRTQG